MGTKLFCKKRAFFRLFLFYGNRISAMLALLYSVSLHSLATRTDEGFLKDEVPQLWSCLFSLRRFCSSIGINKVLWFQIVLFFILSYHGPQLLSFVHINRLIVLVAATKGNQLQTAFFSWSSSDDSQSFALNFGYFVEISWIGLLPHTIGL